MAREPEGTDESGLSDTEIESIADRLRRGVALDDSYRSRLFRQPRETELTYSAKDGRGEILARTMAVPLQTLKQFGTDASNVAWSNKLIFGDNLQVLKTLFDMKEHGDLRNADGSSGVRLCYIDPPFATRREFRTSKGQMAYRDKVEGAEFIEFLRKRLIFVHELLSEDGALYLHLDTNKVHYVKVLLDEIFGPQNFRSEIIWKRSSAHSDTKQGRRQHGRIHDTILFYSKSDTWLWNPVFLPYTEDYDEKEYRHIAPDGRRYKQADLTAAKPGGDTSYEWRIKRPIGTPKWSADLGDEWRSPKKSWEYKAVTPYKGRYWAYAKSLLVEFEREKRLHYRSTGMPRLMLFADEMEGVALQDLWTDIVPVSAGATERTEFPTQKPLALLERIIESSSNPGDLVLDCFAGSGTTAVAAEELGRRWIAVDCGKFAVYTSQRRLLALSETDGKRATPSELQPLELCSAGLYDNKLLEDLSHDHYDGYEAFCLKLFGCRAGEQTIAGIRMAGTRKGDPVHIYPFNETEAVMGREYIEDLHARLRSQISGTFYVIAPVSACDPGLFEDVIRLQGSTYFILRVPYSVIRALHERDFESLSQPDSEADINDALDSFGFDFVEIPEIEYTAIRSGSGLRIEVVSFRRGGLDPDDFADLEDAGRRDLAMAMVDNHYDGDVFRLGEYRFGKELVENEWGFEVSLTDAGEEALLIFMDTRGNERREVVSLKQKHPPGRPEKRATAKKRTKRSAAKA